MGLTPEQLEDRRGGVGSSEIAAVMGWSPFSTPMGVYAAKQPGYVREGASWLEAGDYAEAMIAQRFSKEYGIRIARNRTRDRSAETVTHPLHRWMKATADFFEVDGRGRYWRRKRIVECKNVTNRDLSFHWGRSGTDEIPRYVLCQVLWQMAVYGLAEAWVCGLFFGRDLRVYRINFDLEAFMYLFEEAFRFWFGHVVPGIPPMDGSDAGGRYLQGRTPTSPLAPMLDTTPEADRLVEAYKFYGAGKDYFEERQKDAKHRLEEMIGEHEGIRGPWGKITWNHRSSGKYDHKAIIATLWDVLTPEQRLGVGSLEELHDRHALKGTRFFDLRPSKQFAEALELGAASVHLDDPTGAACGSRLGIRNQDLQVVTCEACRTIAQRRLGS